ncbi:MAG: hypothetical protein ACPGTU_09945 [Myxococcota bacterium]
MSDYARHSRSGRRTSSSTESSTSSGSVESNAAALEEMPKEQVMIYLTQNSVTHQNDEIPETLAALQKADQSGLGKKSMIPISDPFSDGHTTDQYAFGQSKADSMTWWHDDSNLKSGQVRIGDQVLSLGAAESGIQQSAINQIQADWMTALQHVGLASSKAKGVIDALMTSNDGTAQLMHSGGRACNELLQLISVLNRAEMGEFEISSFVISGHHYRGTSYIFGEMGDHEYDSDQETGDTLDVRDIENLSSVFPKAFAQVDSFMFSACNTHDLGLQDEQGQDRSTGDWVSSTFPEAERMALWKDIAPGSDYAAFISGEFALDIAKEENGQNTAFDDLTFKKTQKGTHHRFEKGADGTMSEIDTERTRGSYPYYNDYKGLRNSNHEAFHKRSDLMEYILKKS